MSKRKSTLPLLTNVPLKADPLDITSATPTIRWVRITPEVATKWLDETNTNNRTVREDYVMRLASDMKDGKWRGRNGEAIRFDSEGRLVDGQHRLWACVIANKPFDTLLVSGIARSDYSTIGVGKSKTFSDFLGPVQGEKNTALLSSSLRIVYMWLNGHLDSMKDGKLQPTVTKLQQVLKDNPQIRDSVNYISCHKEIRILNPTIATLIHFAGIISGKQAKVEMFLEQVGNGLGLTLESPAYQLRKVLLAQRSSQPGKKRVSQEYLLALAIKAWNAAKDGKPIKNLNYKIGEGFPQL